jgi:hypothetical protein
MPNMPIPDDFDPKPTIPTGGLERMIQFWEASRDTNSGGYGGGSVLQQILDWGTKSSNHTTSCSPFTATCIGMMFDPGGATDDETVYAPVINNGTSTLALPLDYYRLHNGYYFKVDPDVPNSAAIVAARKQRFDNHGWPQCDDPALATVFFNLGYAIDIRDVRRGDLISITWASGGGHAGFVWDVHTDEDNAVDCLQFLSANGGGTANNYHGPGVSVSAPNDAATFIDHANRQFTKKFQLFVDNDLYLTDAWWYCLPGVKRNDVKLETFRSPNPSANRIVDKANNGGAAMAELRAVRFWGFAPPDAPHGDALTDEKRELATHLCQWQMTPPYGIAG